MKTIYLAIVTILGVSFVNAVYAQSLNLKSLANFVLFTSDGAVGNTGISYIGGHIGTNTGAITGFGAPSTVSGNIYNDNAVTLQAITDLESAYTQLSAFSATNTGHAPAFGTGETLFSGVYAIAGAASVAGTLTLDAQGDPTAIFIFKIAGAFTTGASATIILTNGASACNVFWVAEGAISMATLTVMKGTLIAHPGAASMGAGCQLEGRLFSTTGAVSVYGVMASIPSGCINTTTWTGAEETSNWYTSGNWSTGVPDGVLQTWIPSILLPGRFYPVINSGTATVDSIHIDSGASVTLIYSTLEVKGAIINTGILDAANGSIEMKGSMSQTIKENTFKNNAVKNLVISNQSVDGVIIADTLDIYGSLTYSGTGMKLFTNDLLTLKSNALNTARVGNMTGDFIIGKVTVERYLFARKGWRFLSIPTNSIQTIKESWQEGATTTASDPVNGFGTQITSNLNSWLTNGFDLYSANGPSMKTFDPLTGSWIGVANTNPDMIKTKGGYMVFIRGDRTANTFNSIATETVLRTKGVLYTGDQEEIFIDANQFASIGNPYASAIDLRRITKSGLKDFFYVWDPKLEGGSGYGGYQTFSYNGSDYIITPGYGSYGAPGTISNFLESGQAFLIQANNTTGSLKFTEATKADQNSARFPGTVQSNL